MEQRKPERGLDRGRPEIALDPLEDRLETDELARRVQVEQSVDERLGTFDDREPVPEPAAGDVGEVFLIENTAAAVLKVYPDSGSQINSLTATTGAYSVAASATVLLVRASSTKLIAVGKF